MGKRLFVGSLPFETTEQQLKELFVPFGTVVSAKLIIDRETNKSKGFGFVEMSTDDEAKAAVAKLQGSTVGSRRLVVNEARPMEKRPPGSFGPPKPSGRGGFGGGKPGGFSGGRGGRDGGRGSGRGGGKDFGGGFDPFDDGPGGKSGGKRRKKGMGKPKKKGRHERW